MPEIIRRRVNPNTGEVLGTTVTKDLNVPYGFPYRPYGRGQRPFIFDNVIVEEYFSGELAGYSHTGEKLWERGIEDDLYILDDVDGYWFEDGHHVPREASVASDGHMFYVRLAIGGYNSNPRVYVFKASPTDGAVVGTTYIEIPETFSTDDLRVGGIFSTKDYVVVSNLDDDTEEISLYVLDRNTLSLVNTLTSDPVGYFSDRTVWETNHVYSPVSNSAVVSIAAYTVWADFSTWEIKGLSGNFMTESRLPVITTNGVVFKDVLDYDRLTVLRYYTDTEISNLPSLYNVVSSGKEGQPLDPGVYFLPNLPMSVPYILPDVFPNKYALLRNFTPQGQTEPGDWLATAYYDSPTGTTSLDFIRTRHGVIDITEPPINLGVFTAWGSTYNTRTGFKAVVETDNYLLFLSDSDGGTVPRYRYNKNTHDIDEIEFSIYPYPHARDNFSYAVDGDLIYLIGWRSSIAKDDSFVLDMSDKTAWSITSPLGFDLRGYHLVSGGGSAGYVDNGTLYMSVGNQIYAYDISDNSWSVHATPPGGFYGVDSNYIWSLPIEDGIFRFLYRDFNTGEYEFSTYDVGEDVWDNTYMEVGHMVDGGGLIMYPLGDNLFLAENGVLLALEGAVYPY